MDIKSVAFAIPSLTHSVAIEFNRSAMRTDWLLASAGWERAYLDHCGCQFVANARNELVHDFLAHYPTCDNFFFLDDDLGWTPEAVLRILERDEDIIAGVYPKRQDEEDWPVMLAGDNGKLIEKDGLVRAMRAPTGFMRIKRRVLEAMTKAARPYRWMNPAEGMKEIPTIFSVGLMDDGWFWTEDYIFCHNAAQMGFEIWIDPDVVFTHRGPKAWKGTLKDQLPTFRKRARQALKARKIINLEPAEGQPVRSDAA